MSDDNVFEEEPTQPIPEVKEETVNTEVPKDTRKSEVKEEINYSVPPKEQYTYTFSLPPAPLRIFTEKIAEANNIPDLDTKSVDMQKWKKVAEDCVENYTLGGLLQDRVDDVKSDFLQGVENKDNNLVSFSSPKFRKTDGELTGEVAVLKVSKLLGLGDVLNIPLPHSGITLTIKPPTERDVIDFYNSIFREKIYLGRMTQGLTLSNHSVYINNKLFDFIIKHVHSISYSDISKDQLRNYILLPDFHILAWGFAATMYPNGFEYERPCINDIEKCNYVAKDTINMLKLLWIDNTALTDNQKAILIEQRPNKLTIDSYNKYKADHTKVFSKTITLKNSMKFHMKVPTFGEYVADGMGWVNKINTSIDNILITEGDENSVKSEMLQQYVKSSILRQFSHYIDYIEVEDSPITDRETMNNVLDLLSSEDDIRNELTEETLKYKSDTTMALIGIPDFKCPKCNHEQNPDPVNDRLANVIPLDVMMLFFTLLTLRVSRILER